MTRKLADSAVVITGASSGIGRATAILLARRGAAVVLAARGEDALREVEAQCRSLGAQAYAVPTDVADEEQVQQLARHAIERLGRIDVWVNNAAVTAFGWFEETPTDVFCQVIDTNLFGYVHGARAALPYFREQGAGVLINVSSIVGTIGQPYTSAYVASKFAVRGFSESLRQELHDTDIEVCTVMPAAIDTPLFQHGANYMGRRPRPLNPVYASERVASAIASCAEDPEVEVFVGNAGNLPGRLHEVLHALVPSIHERLVAVGIEKGHFTDELVPPTPGNVFDPHTEENDVSGGWRQSDAPVPTRVLAAFLILPLGLALWSARRRHHHLDLPSTAKMRDRGQAMMSHVRASTSRAADVVPGATARLPVRGRPESAWRTLLPVAALLPMPRRLRLVAAALGIAATFTGRRQRGS